MTVKGTTSHRLDLVKSYNPTQPYIVGVNGVTSITTNSNGIDVIKYVIDNITYETTLSTTKLKPSLDTSPASIKSINVNNRISSNRSYQPNTKRIESVGPIDDVYPTTFSYTVQPQPLVGSTDYFVFKDEAKMGVVFTPKVEDEVFIERQDTSVFEPQSRLSNIVSLEGLIEYNNGYYKILNL